MLISGLKGLIQTPVVKTFILEMPNKLKKVYELEGLVCDLHTHFTAESGSTMGISKSKATELISSTIFDYEPNSRYVLADISFLDSFPCSSLPPSIQIRSYLP